MNSNTDPAVDLSVSSLPDETKLTARNNVRVYALV